MKFAGEWIELMWYICEVTQMQESGEVFQGRPITLPGIWLQVIHVIS